MSCRLRQPQLPCVDVGTRQKPNYLPMELTHIARGQTAKLKITEAQKNKMLQVATMAPRQHLATVRQSLANTGIAGEARLRAFNMSVSDTPVEVTQLPPHRTGASSIYLYPPTCLYAVPRRD